MKKFFGLALAGALLVSGAAFATQQIQDNLNITGFTTFGQHIGTVANQVPTVTGTGTPAIATGSSDTSGVVTAGASATSVVITFADAYAIAPACNVSNQSQITSFAYTVSTTAITITQTATSGNLIVYNCIALGSGL